MDWKEFFRLNKLKVFVIILTFLIVFFVKIPALFNPCNWRACPDYIGTDIISVYPSFYKPAGCGWGIAYICWEASWLIPMLVFDIIIWAILNLIIFSIIYKFKK